MFHSKSRPFIWWHTYLLEYSYLRRMDLPWPRPTRERSYYNLPISISLAPTILRGPDRNNWLEFKKWAGLLFPWDVLLIWHMAVMNGWENERHSRTSIIQDSMKFFVLTAVLAACAVSSLVRFKIALRQWDHPMAKCSHKVALSISWDHRQPLAPIVDTAPTTSQWHVSFTSTICALVGLNIFRAVPWT